MHHYGLSCDSAQSLYFSNQVFQGFKDRSEKIRLHFRKTFLVSGWSLGGQPGDRETGQDAEASHASETLRTESNCSGLEGEFFNLGVFG